MPEGRGHSGRPTPTLSTPVRRRRLWQRLRPPRDPVVLMHHGFCEHRRADDPENLCVESGRFEEQLRWLIESGWQPLDLDAYVAWLDTGRRPAPRSFLLTIDDGFVSVARHGLPVAGHLGVPLVLYVPADLLGATAIWLPLPADEPILAADDLRRVAALPGVEIGLHGGDHRDMSGLEERDLKGQVARARDTLEASLGASVRSFAYPYGSHDTAARAAVAAEGFDHAFSVFDDAGRFAISRIDVNATDTLASFRIKVGMPHYRLAWRSLHRATFVRRVVRALATGRSGGHQHFDRRPW